MNYWKRENLKDKMDTFIIDASVILAILQDENYDIPDLENLAETYGIICPINFNEIIIKIIELALQQYYINILTANDIIYTELQYKFSNNDVEILNRLINSKIIMTKLSVDKVSTNLQLNQFLNNIQPVANQDLSNIINDKVNSLHDIYSKNIYDGSLNDLNPVIQEISLYKKYYSLSLGDLYCLALGKYLQKTVYTADRAWLEIGLLAQIDVKSIRS